MAMTKRRKICIAVAVVLVLVFIVTPFVLGAALKGEVESKIGEVTKAPVKLGGLSIKLLPPGAVLSDLELGEAVSQAGGAPLARIETLKAGVSWSTVFGGATHVTSLKLYDADIALACEETGSSNLQRFLDNMGPSNRKAPLPIDALVVKNAKITCYVPQRLIAPKSKVDLAPMTIEVGYLGVDDIVVPPPGQLPKDGEWMAVEAQRVKASAPLSGVASPASAPEAGAAMEEGLQVDELELEVSLPTANSVMKIRDGSVNGLRLRNVLQAPRTPETIERIVWSLKLATGAASEVKKKRQVLAERRAKSPEEKAAVVIEDLKASDSAIEIAGPDAHGNAAFYRLTRIEVDIQDFPWGLGAGVPEGRKGHLRVVSPSKSMAGDGRLSIEWTDIEGQWPKLSFDTKEELTGFPLAPLSTRVEQRTGAGVQGSLASVFAGPTRDGAITWDGTVTLSGDTKLVGKSAKGKIMSVASSISGVPKGRPIEGFGVRGTLDSPRFRRPGAVPKAVIELATQMFKGDTVSLPGVLLKGTGEVINRGLGEGKDLIEKVPGLGDLLK